ncbi:MAG: transcriptional regulator [Bacteroidetes bacterium 4572_117]|nr:MAG: transcriptional regulator [Bacteroidetes bacterium 4572_117]
MKSDRLRTKSLDEMIDMHIGVKGTEKRNAFEEELRLDILGQTIKKIRKERQLTQAQLGELVGVKKAQISKIENNLTDEVNKTKKADFNRLFFIYKFVIFLE